MQQQWNLLYLYLLITHQNTIGLNFSRTTLGDLPDETTTSVVRKIFVLVQAGKYLVRVLNIPPGSATIPDAPVSRFSLSRHIRTMVVVSTPGFSQHPSKTSSPLRILELSSYLRMSSPTSFDLESRWG
jgi:hypothetical protein